MEKSKLCLICLCEKKQNLISIFAQVQEIQNSIAGSCGHFKFYGTKDKIDWLTIERLTIKEMLGDCSPEEVYSIQNVYNQICKDCVRDLITAYLFRTQCRKAVRELKKQLLKRPVVTLPAVDNYIDVTPVRKTYGKNAPKYDIENVYIKTEKIDDANDYVLLPRIDNFTRESQVMQTDNIIDLITLKDVDCANDDATQCKLDFNSLEENYIKPCESAEPSRSANTPKVRILRRLRKVETRNYQCYICQHLFPSITKLKCHLITHDDRPYKCGECGLVFIRAIEMWLHRIHHSKKQIFICQYCGRGCTRADKLEQHIQNCKENKDQITVTEIDGKEKVQCPVCQKVMLKYSLQRHAIIHSRETFDCKYCDAKFQTSKELFDHSFTHPEERPLLCTECGFTCRVNSELVMHMRRHNNDRPNKCEYCGKGFYEKFQLTNHLVYHTGEKKHSCPVCKKAFYHTKDIRVHLRTHTGERPYKCRFCDKAFTQSHDHKVHVRRFHTGERFKCSKCDASFLRNYQLTVHKRDVHGMNIKLYKEHLKIVVPKSPEDATGNVKSNGET